MGDARDARADTPSWTLRRPISNAAFEAERRAYEAEAAYETLLEQVPGAIYVVPEIKP
jgi:hypothetical protein